MIKFCTVDRNKINGYSWVVKRVLRKFLNRKKHLPSTSTPIVVFRLDDVGFNANSAQLCIMNLFLLENVRLSLGLVLNSIDDDGTLLSKIQEGYSKGIFELVLHGYNHVDHSKLTEKEQERLLLLAYEKTKELFGEDSMVFIPPYNRYNDSTLRAMNKLGLRIISSMINYEDEKDIFTVYTGRTDRNSIYHIPEMTSFETWDKKGNPVRKSISSILRDIEINIHRYGYAIITIHPITFLKSGDNKYTKLVDKNQINDLGILINSIKSKGMTITSFNNISNA